MRAPSSWCLALLAVLLCPGPGAALTEADRLEFADGLYARGMYDLAVKEYEAFLRDFPAAAKADAAYFRLGESYRQLGNGIAAEKALRKVFNDYPRSAFRIRAGFRRASLFLDSGLYDSAVDLYQRVLVEKPPDDIACASLYFLSEALLKLGNSGDAVKALEQLGQRFAGTEFHSYGLLKLGEIHAREGREAQALECFAKAAEKPGSARVGAEALFQSAEIEFRRKDFKKSAETYARLLSAYPQDRRSAEAKMQAAWAAHNAGLYAEALQVAGGALKAGAGGQEAEWLYLKANCERQLVKNDEAAATYADMLNRFPASPFAGAAAYERALALYRAGKFAEAVEAARGLKPSAALQKDVYWLLAESNSALGREDEAIQYYRLLLRDFPKSDLADDANFRLAHHLRRRGKLEEAARHYGAVAADFPDSPLAPQALFASAVCLAQLDKHEEAVRDLGALLLKYPADALAEEALYQKAMGEARLERDADAQATLEALLKKNPRSRFAADALYWRGLIRSKLGRNAEAEADLRLALGSNPRDELARDAEYRLAVVLQATGKADEAAALAEKLLKTAYAAKLPPEMLRWLSEYRYDAKQYDAAAAAASALAGRDQAPAWQQAAWCLAGRALLAKGDGDGAKSAFGKSLAAGATTGFAADAALRLGDLAMKAGDSDGAETLYRRSAEISTDDQWLAVRANATAGLGRVAKAKADLATAARFFMSVAVLYDDAALVPECLYEAADAFGRLGRADDSRKAAAELRERYPDSEWAKKAAAAGAAGGGGPPPPAPAPGGGGT
jgi:TolA-binding protein